MSDNKMEITFSAISANEAFARVTVAAFITQLNPTLAELTEVKTAVSEAVTNAIIHGYEMDKGSMVKIACQLVGKEAIIEVVDYGCGIEDIEQAREPLFTTKEDMERSGMGFTIMEEFMDYFEVTSKLGQGTTILMKKKIND